ncbi:MAG: gliding motility lipoprotein GldJ, partial [Flavobacterium sp.]|nr:gliding motility lipoprotein GldJ [Flavobacterium sp.]
MKVNKIMALRLMLSVMLVLGFTSCSKKSSSKNSSRATGWNVDGKKASKKQEAGPGLVFVEG